MATPQCSKNLNCIGNKCVQLVKKSVKMGGKCVHTDQCSFRTCIYGKCKQCSKLSDCSRYVSNIYDYQCDSLSFKCVKLIEKNKPCKYSVDCRSKVCDYDGKCK
jgi:hypothetical protein